MPTNKHNLLFLKSTYLKSNANFKDIFVRPSLTKKQRELGFKIRKELREKREKGEKIRIQGYPNDSNRKVVSVEGEGLTGGNNTNLPPINFFKDLALSQGNSHRQLM